MLDQWPLTESVPRKGDEEPDAAWRRFSCKVISGPDTGLCAEGDGLELSIGTAAGNQLELSDTSVSRYHCVIRPRGMSFEVRDLGSTNGVCVAGVRVEVAFVEDGAVLRLGRTRIRFEILDGQLQRSATVRTSWGRLVGRSPAMRATFARLDKLAQSGSPVLIEGGPGAGKSVVARAIHEASELRNRAPFVIECAMMSTVPLTKDILEQARGTSLIIDDMEELSRDEQSLVMAGLEDSDGPRIIATVGRDVRPEINAGRFSSVLFGRFVHARLRLPDLAERLDDIAILTRRFYRELTGDPDQRPSTELIDRLQRRRWAGNVRELRSVVARAVWTDISPRGSRADTISDESARARTEVDSDTVDEIDDDRTC